MASGSRFCDLFDRVELLLLHSEPKKLCLPCLLVSYKPLANLRGTGPWGSSMLKLGLSTGRKRTRSEVREG